MNRQAKSCGKDGRKAPLESQERFPLSHSFNNNKLDDRDHFLQNANASVASLRRLITPTRNADHDQPGTLITFIGIRTSLYREESERLLCCLLSPSFYRSIHLFLLESNVSTQQPK